MTAPTAPRTGLPTVTITVFDSATVFDGLTAADVIYRYDLPGTGITDGWAGPAVVDQVRQLSTEAWPDIHVRIDASSEHFDIIQRLLANKGVAAGLLAEEEAVGEVSDSGVDAGVESAGKHRLRPGFTPAAGKNWMVIAAVALVAVVLLLSTLYIGQRVFGGRETVLNAVSAETESGPEPELLTSSSVPIAPPPPTEIELRSGTLSVSLPPGFHLEDDAKGIKATGADPDLRIYLSTDPLYSIGQDVLFDEVDRLVASDPELSDPIRTAHTMEYTEDPGDGSRVRWTTWVEGGNQLHVGCHTRVEPTVGQHAACSMATDSFTAER